MNFTTQYCHPEKLEAFLAGELQPADDNALTCHLEDCNPCRQKLERLAAEPENWTEAKALLNPAVFDDMDSEPRKTPLQVQAVLDTLAPTDDPEMLGRLGGYEISGVVGTGGMGIVLKAFDRSLDRTVAIKVLAPHLATSGAARKRFAREARAAAAVLHPNVVAIHGVSHNCDSEDDTLPWLVMPYIRGSSLQKRLDQSGPLPVSEVLRIGSQIASGLAAAHAQGLVHRDIKPANILLEEGVERVAITDFGLARAVDDATMTRSGIISGTPQYMSPEQARGETVDCRSDLFSLGSVLYAMCTGHAPFRAETTFGVMRRITDDQPRPVRELNPDVPDWLCVIIGKLVDKDAAERFESAAKVADLLEDCLAHVQQPTMIPLPETCQALLRKQSRKLSRSANGSRAWFGNRMRRWPTVAAGVLFLGTLAAIAWLSPDPPEISGRWNGDGWGRVELVEVGSGKYTGFYTNTWGKRPGWLDLKWSRIERRYKGTWRDGDLRFGKISLRFVDEELRGAWTTSKKSKKNPGIPELADLLWTREADSIPGTSLQDKTGYPSVASLSEPLKPEPRSNTPLIDAVHNFNKQHLQGPIGRHQPPLTDDEIVAAIRWASRDRTLHLEHLTDSDFHKFCQIAEQRILPASWKISVMTGVDLEDDSEFRLWSIRIGNERFGFEIRRQFLGAVELLRRRFTPDASTQRSLGPVDATTPGPVDATTLGSAIREFNAMHFRLDGIDQPPLTEGEIINAIRYNRLNRIEYPVSDAEFAEYQRIATNLVLPKGAGIEVLTTFQPGDGYEYRIWSVRLRMPRQGDKNGSYAYTIREQFISSHSIDSHVAWGPVAANGLQAGVRVSPRNELYTSDQRVTPVFLIRNTADTKFQLTLPRIMTFAHIDEVIARDSAGTVIPVSGFKSGERHLIGGAWGVSSFGFGSQQEIQGQPFAIGELESTDGYYASFVVPVQPGQSARIRFVLPNYGDHNAAPLTTGDVLFSLAGKD